MVNRYSHIALCCGYTFIIRNHRIDSTSQVQAYYHYQDEQLGGPAHQGGGLEVPGADDEAAMEREVGGDVPIADGRGGSGVVTRFKAVADPEWSDGNPPGRKNA